MEISVVYAGEQAQSWIELNVEDGCTVDQAINLSGILRQFPEIDIQRAKVGIFGKFTKLDSVLNAGDRVEIYRPIIRVLDDDDDEDDD
ncbi:MAG: RnfH family protein [Gammaproteobacteria bacterium]|nr:MAG: RnfH family protein [Gammaproteobacteria bacterium]